MSPYYHHYQDQNDHNREMPMSYPINYYEPYHVMQRGSMVEPGNHSMLGAGTTAQPMLAEGWKISSQQQQQQQQQQLQQPEVYRLPCTPSKPLPQEPPAPPPRHQSLMANAVADAGSWYPSDPPYWSYPPTSTTTNSSDSYMMDHQPQPHTPPDFEHPMIPYEQPQYYDSYVMVEKEVDQLQSPKKQSISEKEKSPKKSKRRSSNNQKMENDVRQITVQSINKEHRVWIDINTTETGKTLAEKIHTIATFSTKKILSITTASGRSIPLDHRPVFGSWMDMDSFEDGEQWKVEWGELDRGFIERLFSRFVHVSGSKRK